LTQERVFFHLVSRDRDEQKMRARRLGGVGGKNAVEKEEKIYGG